MKLVLLILKEFKFVFFKIYMWKVEFFFFGLDKNVFFLGIIVMEILVLVYMYVNVVF